MKTRLLLVFTALPLFLIAQSEPLYTFENSYADVRSMQRYDDEMLCEIRRTNGASDFYKTDLRSGHTQRLLTDQRSSHTRYNENGLFFTTADQPATPTKFYLNYLSLDGTHSNLRQIGIYQPNTSSTHSPAHAAVFQGKYYVNGFQGSHFVWESDATAQGTRTILSTPHIIRKIETTGQALLIIIEQPDAWQFLGYEGTEAPAPYYALPKVAWSSDFSIVARHGTYLYFNATDALGQKAVWRTDGTEAGTGPFCIGHHARKFIFDDAGFVMETGGPHGPIYYFRAAWSSPCELRALAFHPDIASGSARIFSHLGGRYFFYQGANHGREVVRLNAEFDFELHIDLMPGPASGLALLHTGASPNYFHSGEDLYLPLTNGHDPFIHLYLVNDSGAFPVFRMDSPGGQSNFFLFEDWIYWFQGHDNQLALYRHLNQRDAPSQPQAPVFSEAWRREVARIDTISGFSVGDPSDFLRTQGIWIDHEDNVIMSMASDFWRRKLGLSHHAGLDTTLVGANGFVKFNKYGEVQWTKVFGFNALPWNNNPHILTIDQNGDLLVLGIHGLGFSIDGVPITAPRNFGRYVVKLDGETGKLLWARNVGSSHFSNDMDLDGILTDKDNNAYVALKYRNFSLQLGPINLTTNKSPGHAIIKLDPDGNVLWAKNLENPWTNREAFTLVFTYDAARNTLWSVQTQMGHYSSVWGRCPFDDFYNIIQERDTDGNVLSSKQIKGNDWNGITAGAALPGGRFFAAGYYRHNITLDRFFSNTPPKANACPDKESYHFILDNNTQTVSEASVSQEQWFFPYQAKMYNNHIYMLGGEGIQLRRLALHKFDLSGRLLGIKYIGERYGSHADRFEHFDVRNGFIAVTTTDLRNEPQIGLFSLFPNAHAVQVFRIPDTDWEAPGDRYRRMELDWPFQNDQLYLFPNPTTDRVQVFLKEPQSAAYDRYEVYDLQGRRIAAGPVSREQLIEIDLTHLPAGAYVVQLLGSGGVATGKVIKH